MVERMKSDPLRSLPQLDDSASSPEVIQPGLKVLHKEDHTPSLYASTVPAPVYQAEQEESAKRSLFKPPTVWLLVLSTALALALAATGGGLGYAIHLKSNELQAYMSSFNTSSPSCAVPLPSDTPWANWTCQPNQLWTSNLTNFGYVQWCNVDIAVGGGNNIVSPVVQSMNQCVVTCDVYNVGTSKVKLAVWSSNGNKYGDNGRKNAVGECFCAPATNGYQMANVSGVFAYLRSDTINATTLAA